jgi:outer membrane protein OmpA-like peptidoglycan-associated protein
MRWLVGIALASVTGIGIAEAQTTEAQGDPSVTVDLSAIPSKDRPRVYSGERVVFPLIYPDGSMAARPTKPAATAPSEAVKLTPPEEPPVEAANPPAESAPAAAAATATTQPTEAVEPVPAENEQAALVAPGPVTEVTGPTSRVPSPKPKPFGQSATSAADSSAAEPATEANTRTRLFSQPPARAEEQREAKPDAQLAAISPELATAPTNTTPQILFVAGRTELDGAGMAVLDVLALQLGKTKERIELQAFASASPGQPDSAKKLSLRRALNIRTYLITKGINGDRIIIKAKGDAKDGTPERVDVIRAAG